MIEFASVLPLIIFKAYLPRILGYTIVADRYVLDTLVYLHYWLGDKVLRSYVAKVLPSLIPPNSVIIHLDAELQVLLKRLKYETATPDFVKFQRRAYRILADEFGATTIDTSKFDIDETFRNIIKTINF